MAEATLNKKEALFANRLQLNLKMEVVKCYTWSIALYGSERLTLRTVDRKYLWSFGMWCWTVMEITWTDRVKNKVAITQSQWGKERPTYSKTTEA